MPPKGPTSIRLSPEIKQALQEIADYEYRSPSNMIEFLIVERCRKMGIAVDVSKSKRTGKGKPRASQKRNGTQGEN